MKRSAAYWIERLQLTGHAEGGYFREIYRSPMSVARNHLPEGFPGDRSISTSIYFLLTAGQFSAFHRIRSDELWHFYNGDPVHIYELDRRGVLTIHRLGANPDHGENFQAVVRAGNWFASRVAEEGEYALTGCTVAPGFDFADFELASGQALAAQYPQHAGLIRELTRG